MRSIISFYTVIAAFLCGGVNAASFGFSLLHDGDTTSGGGTATTLSELVEYGTGVVEVRDSAVTPGGLATFASGDITAFRVTMTDDLGNALEWNLVDDPSTFDDDDFGVRFDALGQFARFDSPETSTCAGCFFMRDDEFATPGRASPGPVLTIVDEEPRVGILAEDVDRFGVSYTAGDIVLLRNFEGIPTTVLGNTYTVEDSEGFGYSSGYVLPIGALDATTPVPLSGALP